MSPSILIVGINSKSFPWTAGRTGSDFHPPSSRTASKCELFLTLLIHSRCGTTVLDIALLLSLV